MRLIDHAAGRVGADACRAAGYDGAVRYLANSPDRGLPNKILLPEEAARYLELGMPLVSNWQRGKDATADWRRGFDGGVADALAAQAHHALCGGPDHAPIYFSVDEDVNLATWNSLVLPYLNGAASVIGKHRVGVYGGQRSMWWAAEDGFRWRWQTKGWSRYDLAGRWDPALPVQWVEGVQLRQERVDQDQINGIGIDVNTVWATDFGQWQYDRTQPEVPAMQDPTTRVQLSPNRHGGGRNVTWIALHTQEGPGTAASLTNYLGRSSSQVSYNAVVDDEETVLVVPWGENPWAASNANNRADHICLAGTYANWSRGKWLEKDSSDGVNEDLMLTRAAALVAWRCIERGIPIEYVGDSDIPPDRPGICGHRDFGQWGGGHTDPGPNFPWDELIRRAQAFAGGAYGGTDMALTDRFTNFEGREVDLATAFHWIDKRSWQNERMLMFVIDQLTGPGNGQKVRDALAELGPGWDQNGGRTLNDLLAAVAAKNGVGGAKDSKAK
ncbi:DUF1906 domain-containing protein [Nocardia cyriacigeorgica]|uniref:glycoside hydrolase domain-containing protein n=1 Tax=Nocardia cyriacigeorgica TaxID=135487 RepID=UPI001895A982|nr:glycoside hydrolase domain-containing protein [Nocardia cyriacigeorgica]MBF6326597.1 DUF1906 domain-containing protein [Nocardia cyriacigeorgica]